MAHLTNFSFEFFHEIFTEDASLLLLYHGAKKSKMTKNSNQGGGPALRDSIFGVTHGFFGLRQDPPLGANFATRGRSDLIFFLFESC